MEGIFCLEGEWHSDLRRRMSVRPVLELLESLGIATFIHRDVASRGDLDYYLRKWKQARYSSFTVLYLAMHGEPKGLELGNDSISLEELANVLSGSCKGRIVYFGSCLTSDADEASLRAFARETGARAVVGYAKEVDWLQSASFEVVLLDRLVSPRRSDALFNQLTKDYAGFTSELGLVIATANRTYRAS